MDKTAAEKLFQEACRACGTGLKPFYKPAEVASILGVSRSTIVNLTNYWEPEGTPGRATRVLESYRTKSGHRRIPQASIVEYLRRNHSYERANDL